MTAAALLIACACLILALVATELALRAMFRRSGYFVWPRFYRRVIFLDRETFPQLEAVARFEGNGDGERAMACPNGPAVHRVLVLGGSTVESALNDQASSWPAVAEALLNRSGALQVLGANHVHVGNVGRSGMDVQGVAHVLERTLGRYPNLASVWMMVGPGDLMRWLEAGAPPDAAIPPLDVNRLFAENPETTFGLHPKRLALTALMRRLRLRWLRPVERREKAGRWMARARTLRKNAERFITEVPDTSRFLERFEADLDLAVRRASSAARQVVLIRQPSFRKAAYTAEEESLFWNGGIGNAYSGAEVKVFYSTEVILSVLDRIEDCITRVADRHGAVFVETRFAVEQSAATFYDHFHMTPTGAAQLASAVAQAVLASARS